MYIYTINFTHTILCMHNYNYSYKCMFINYKSLRKTLKYL